MLDKLKTFFENNDELRSGPVILYGRAKKIPGLEHINIYRFETAVYIQLYTAISESMIAKLVTLAEQYFPGCRFSIVDRSRVPPRMLFLSPEIDEEIVFCENGLSFYLDLMRPSHPGLFFDIEPTRRWVMDNSAGRKVLNLFAFTCAFGVCALAGGADSVVNMDNNSNILARGRRNHQLNDQDMSRIRFEKKDVLKSFGFIDRTGPYGLIICDPPSAQGTSFNAERDYARVVGRLRSALDPGGVLLLCLNSPFLGFDFIETIIGAEALEEICRIEPPAEFRSADRNEDLKVICVRLKK